MKSFIVFFAVVASVYASTNVERCIGNSGPLPLRTIIPGCRNPPCSFPQLRYAVINMSFVAPRNIRSMRTLAIVHFGAIPISFDLGAASDTCNFLNNSRCPIERSAFVNYSLRMFIEPFFPVGSALSVEFRVVDENNDAVICVRVPIRIEGPRKILNEIIEA